MAQFHYGLTQSTKLPGPELTLELQAPTASEPRQKVICLIDTAACVSCMPETVLANLRLEDYTTRRLTWGSGEIAEVRLYAVNLVIGRVVFNDLFVAETKRPYGLIGRDLLNKHKLTCDGPNQVWDLEPPWL